MSVLSAHEILSGAWVLSYTKLGYQCEFFFDRHDTLILVNCATSVLP